MGLQNSQVDFFVDLCCFLLADNPLSTSQKEVSRDIERVRHSVKYSGIGFLTKDLPALGKALDDGLNSGQLSLPLRFKRAKGKKTPAFMQMYFKAVFSDDGLLLDHPDVDAIKHLRQVLFHAYKLELDFTSEQESRVIESFVSCEAEIKSMSYDAEVLSLIETASHVVENVLNGFNHKDIQPRHGPGAVATGEKLEEKWTFGRLFSQIHQVYPYYDYYIVGGGRELLDRLDWYKHLERHESGVARVILVPKDSRGPRLISCEPLEYQWIQQGLGRKIVSHLESSPLTRGQINFTDQTINQKLALRSSVDRKFATLDLKDASDRVSVKLVSLLFARKPELLKALLATRTTATTLPSGEVLPLDKFAPMGSALCFPIEALCFWAICVATILRKERAPLQNVGDRVFVYGDDIIVPTHHARDVMHALESVGLKVNTSKSCIDGSFRESCGVDAFRGKNVTPFRIKTIFPTTPVPDALSSYTAFANHLETNGYTLTYRFLKDSVEKLYGRIPYGVPTSSFPCWYASSARIAESRNETLTRKRWNASLQRLEFKVRHIKSRRKDSKLDGWNRLLRDQISPVAGLTDYVVVPRSTLINWGWKAV